MYRTAEKYLQKWKSSINRKSLMIRGARQVGKTWLMKKFGESYQKCAYINFENNSRLKKLFTGDFEITRIIAGLEMETNLTIESENTLIIFDEVQEVPEALTSLKYFCENAPEYHIIAAGSLLGVALHPGTSFTVGKVSFLDLHPMSFIEYVHAVETEKVYTTLKKKKWDLIKIFKSKYIELLKQYYFIGGMPEAVAAYKETKNFHTVREVQKRILQSYEQDFSKHAPNAIVPRIRMLWNSIPAQLAKENRKFIYGLIRNGARAREYELAINWLIDCNLIHKTTRISKPNIPIVAYEDSKFFKLFVLDVGLLSAMCSIDVKTLLDGNECFKEFKGALTEQYALQQLKAENDFPIHYWSNSNGKAEVDFISQIANKVIPVEVKATTNRQAKSLQAYREKYSPSTSVRTSLADYTINDKLTNIPLYALHEFKSELME